MKTTKPYIIPLLFLLIFSTGCTHAQKPMKILLAEGYENQPVRTGNTTVEPVRLYIQEKPWNDRSVSIFLELDISENDKKYSTYLNFWEVNTSGLREDYPKAYGRHLFGLEVDDTENKPKVFLTIEKNNFGKPFFLDLNQETMIDGLTVRFDMSMIETVSRSPNQPEYNMGTAWIVLSENGEKETIYFDTDELFEKKKLSFEWKDYRIWVLDYTESAVQLKIEKK